jgi:hypothetical protein
MFSRFFLAAASSALFTASAFAQSDPFVQQIKTDGNIVQMSVGGDGQTPPTSATMWFLSSGNESETFLLTLQGAPGVTAQVQSTLLNSKQKAAAALSTKGANWVPVTLRTANNDKGRQKITIKSVAAEAPRDLTIPDLPGIGNINITLPPGFNIPGGGTTTINDTSNTGNGSNPGGTNTGLGGIPGLGNLGNFGLGDIINGQLTDEICAALPMSVLQTYVDMATKAGLNLSPQKACVRFFGAQITGSSGGFGASLGQNGLSLIAAGLIHKDACHPQTQSKYLVRVLLTFDKVDPAAMAQGVTLGVSVKLNPHKGSEAASIKPSSDGRYHPQPLLLMSSLGFSFAGNDESVNIIHFKGPRIARQKTIPVINHLAYGSLYLTISLLTNVLDGGYATFELTNGDMAYGVCFKAERFRQRANGYPGG